MKKLLMSLTIMLLISLSLYAVPASSKQVLRLTSENTVVLVGEVSRESIKKLIEDIRYLDKKLLNSQPLYLILNTPGGSVFDGMDLISMIQGLNREVHTITVYAASMGFIIAQNLGTRYILQNGVLMSHRMKTNIPQGEVLGELDEALTFARAISREVSKVCADRIGISVEDYEKRISDEWWLFGQHAVDNKVADEVATVSCSESLVDSGKCPF